jgi:hypothetical protein
MFFWLSLGVALALVTGPAQADNDYYDSVSGGAGARQPAPRVALQNGELELVAVAQGMQLVIYLDRFDDGTQIENAQIDVGTRDETLRASPVKSGLYVLTADWLATLGRHDLRFTVNTERGSITLAGTLVIPAAKAEAAKAETGEVARDDGDNSPPLPASPLTINLPIEAVLGIGLGVLAALGFSAFAAFRGARSRAAAGIVEATALQDLLPRKRRFADFALSRPVRRVGATLAVLLIISLLLLDSGVLARKDGKQQAMGGGVVGLVR